MPECYTHVQTAMQALMRSGHTVASQPAFIAGANGPDPLYMYHIWRRQRRPNLPVLAAKMHKEKTGAFLLALLRYASTSVQQSFALGYVTHYTTDCTLHPYLAAMSMDGAPYAGPEGRFRMAAAMDSTLYYNDYKTYLVPLHAGTPVLITDDLAQVTTLLREAIAEVYEVDVPLLALADTYHDNLATRRRMISKTGIGRLWMQVNSPKGLLAKYCGKLTSRMQPAKPLRALPKNWKNPYTGDEMDLTLEEVLSLAQQTGAVCITAAMRYWLGQLDETKLIEVLGDNDYYTGLPCKKPEEKKPAPPPNNETAEPSGKEAS